MPSLASFWLGKSWPHLLLIVAPNNCNSLARDVTWAKDANCHKQQVAPPAMSFRNCLCLFCLTKIYSKSFGFKLATFTWSCLWLCLFCFQRILRSHLDSNWPLLYLVLPVSLFLFCFQRIIPSHFDSNWLLSLGHACGFVFFCFKIIIPSHLDSYWLL